MTLLNFYDKIHCDELLEWRKYNQSDNIFNNFSISEWHKIISDISSVQEWNEFLIEFKPIIKCYSLYERNNWAIIGFLFIKVEDYKKRIYSIHGGGCLNGNINHRLYFRGFISFLMYLLTNNIKIRTSCYKDNIRAIKLLKSVGFVKYQETNNIYKYWINMKRLKSGKIYKYLFLENSN